MLAERDHLLNEKLKSSDAINLTVAWPRMRLHTFRQRPHVEINAPAVPEVANGGVTRYSEDPSVPPNAVSENPRIFVENFDENNFVEDPIACYINQAVDVIDLWNRTWFGSYDSNDFYGTSSAESNGHDGQVHPIPPAQRPRLRRQQRPPATPRRDIDAVANGSDRGKWSLRWNLSNSSSGAIAIAAASSASVSAEQQARILQELPGIGTWAGRQRLFSVRPVPEVPTSRTEHPPALEVVAGSPPADATPSNSEKLEDSDADENSTMTTPVHNTNNTRNNALIPENGVRNGAGVHHLLRTSSNTSSEARHRHEAWRWRFTRKWEAEQRRAAEEDPATAEVEDDLEALGYLQACGMGLDLQVMEAHRRGRGRGRGVSRATSGHIKAPTPRQRNEIAANTFPRNPSSVSTLTMQFDVEPSYASAGDLLAGEDSGNFGHYFSTPDPGAASNPAEATRDLLSVAVRGRELLERQRELESEAAARWEEIERSCGCDREWTGLFLPKVEIPMSGNFLYVVLRVAEHQGIQGSRQRFLIRARERSTPMEMLEETIAQAAVVCVEHGLPPVSISLVGAGRMEWRQDTDRHCLLTPAPKGLNLGNVQPYGSSVHTFGGGGSPPGDGAGDVCGLAASLLRQSLPCHFQVTTKAHGHFGQHNGTLVL